MILFTLLTILRVAFVGDPQVDNEVELSYARHSVYAELQERRDLDLVVVLGDLVNENPSMVAPSEAMLDSLHCPWVRVHGNHDGKAVPADTSFVFRGLRLVLLNHEDSKVSDFVDSSGNGKTVVCWHYQYEDFPDTSGNVLYVYGHTHFVRRERVGKTESLGAGATCGTWWRGVKDAKGIPYAIMNCGAPRGYFVADLCLDGPDSDWCRLDYKCVGRPASEKLSVSVRDSLLMVNVYGGALDGRLQMRVRGRWIDIPRVDTIAPEVQDIIDHNNSLSREYRRAHRDEFIPMLRRTSPHLWAIPVGSLPSRLGFRYSDQSMRFKTKVGTSAR